MQNCLLGFLYYKEQNHSLELPHAVTGLLQYTIGNRVILRAGATEVARQLTVDVGV